MNYPHGKLTEKQIRATWFKVPEQLLGFAFDNEFIECLRAARALTESCGGALFVIAWPDGTTITYHMADRTEPMDLENLVRTYKAAAALSRAMEWGPK
jgi:hypothetical protein